MPEGFNQQNVKWVNVNGDAPKPPKQMPAWSKTALFIGGVVIGIGLIGLFLWSIFFGGRTSEEEQLVVETIAEAELACLEMEDAESCLQEVRRNLANEYGDAMYCQGLEGENFDNCVLLAALSSENRSTCTAITEEQKRQTCFDSLFTETFGRNFGYETCAEYFDEEKQQTCEENWVQEKVINNDCQSEYVDDALCVNGAIIARARAAKDPDICQEIQNETERGECLARVGVGDRDFDGLPSDEEGIRGTDDRNPDSDGDGLLDGEEVFEFGTNPALADSDGDGFDDKTEIENGFDPLK